MFQSVPWFIVDGNDEDGDMTRRQIRFQAIEDAPPVDIWKSDIENDRARVEFAGQREPALTARRHDGFKILGPRFFEQPLGEMDIVLDDQDTPFAGYDVGA